MALKLLMVIECDEWSCKATAQVAVEIEHANHVKDVRPENHELPAGWSSRTNLGDGMREDGTEYFCPKHEEGE